MVRRIFLKFGETKPRNALERRKAFGIRITTERGNAGGAQG